MIFDFFTCQCHPCSSSLVSVQKQLALARSPSGILSSLVSSLSVCLSVQKQLALARSPSGVLSSLVSSLSVCLSVQKQLALARSPSGVLSSLVSWLAPGAGVPSLIISSVCAEFPWYAYAVLSVDTDHEGALWRALLAEMRVNPSTTIDQSLLVRTLFRSLLPLPTWDNPK